MEDINFDALEQAVSKKYPGYKLLKLKLPGLKPKFEPKKFSYYPITEEDDIMYVWIVRKNDAVEVEITRDEYTNELANI